MKRVEIGNWCILYHADSTVIMDLLEGHTPDAVIMDPPYGIGLQNAGGGNRNPGGFGAQTVFDQRPDERHEIVGDRSPPNLSIWLDFADQCLLWGADHLRGQLPHLGTWLTWDKTGGHDTFRDSFSDAEHAWHSVPGSAKIIHKMWKGGIRDMKGEEKRPRLHNMQKPVEVMEWCIDQCRLEPGATILDPYMGSGTTAIAAFKKGMNFVGCEIDRRWFDVAVERISRQTSDGPLFKETA